MVWLELMNKEEELVGSKAEMTSGQCRALLPAAACCDMSSRGARQSMIAETTKLLETS